MRASWFPRLLALIVVLAAFTGVAAQSAPPATCDAVLSTALKSAVQNCAQNPINSLCYGSETVSAVPRYLTAEFAFEQPATQIALSQIETFSTRGYNAESASYGIAQVNLSAGASEQQAPLVMRFFGEVSAANSVIPQLAIDVTANTLAPIKAQPANLSATLGSVVPNETLRASGVSSADANAWVRVQNADGVLGWLPAFTLNEAAGVASLAVVSPDARIYSPMQQMTLLSGGADAACPSAPISGALLQSPEAPNGWRLQINGALLEVAPSSTLYLQAQAGGSLDVYALEGSVIVAFNEIAERVGAGWVARVPLDANGAAADAPSAALPAPMEMLGGLVDSALALPRALVLEGVPVAQAEAASLPAVEVTPEQAAPLPAVEVTPEQVAPAAGASLAAVSPFAEAIRARGSVRVGINGALPRFSEEAADGSFSGFEVGLARALVDTLFGEGFPIEYVKVPARQRDRFLAEGSIDLMVRNVGFAPERATWGEWTNTFYFVDGVRLLVRADSGIDSLEAARGRNVGVLAGSPTETLLRDEANAGLGFNIVSTAGIPLDVFNALAGGSVDAIADDWTTLLSLSATAPDPAAYVVVGELLTDNAWNVVVPPTQSAFRDEIDAALVSLVSDGTWQSLYSASFNTPLPPSLELIFAPGVAPVEPLVAAPIEPTPAPAQETAAPVVAAPIEPTPTPAEPTAAPATVPAVGAPPVVGEVSVTIFTAQNQRRVIVITPEGENQFNLQLVRGGEVVYSGTFRFYESSNRWENPFNSFEYIEFSATAGETSLGCEREPDLKGFFSGASFEGRVGC